jgi:hypothetical protein
MDIMTSFFLCLVTIVFMMNMVLTEHARDKEKLLKACEEIMELRKFLPICAKCKKISDSQGEWIQPDTYFASHSDIEFTHGLCQECLKQTLGRKL